MDLELARTGNKINQPIHSNQNEKNPDLYQNYVQKLNLRDLDVKRKRGLRLMKTLRNEEEESCLENGRKVVVTYLKAQKKIF